MLNRYLNECADNWKLDIRAVGKVRKLGRAQCFFGGRKVWVPVLALSLYKGILNLYKPKSSSVDWVNVNLRALLKIKHIQRIYRIWCTVSALWTLVLSPHAFFVAKMLRKVYKQRLGLWQDPWTEPLKRSWLWWQLNESAIQISSKVTLEMFYLTTSPF